LARVQKARLASLLFLLINHHFPLPTHYYSFIYPTFLSSHSQLKMKFSSSIALLALPVLALAAPLDKKDWDHSVDLIVSGIFGFTSTYAAYATPDQV